MNTYHAQHSKALWYTVGPASLGKEQDLFLSGATGVRLTFSFGTPELQLERAQMIKSAASQVECRCDVVADLAGEKIRLGTFANQPTVEARAGAQVVFVPDLSTSPTADHLVLPVPNPGFMSRLKQGSVVTVGDGAAVITITNLQDGQVLGEITEPGVINHTRGLTIQGSDFCPQSLTSKDVTDMRHILSHPEYDYLAVSFVSSESDVTRVREEMRQIGRTVPIVSKIETLQGVENIKQICRVSDFVMAARGDLALAIPWVDLPGAVQEIADAAKATGIPWILGTQIAEGLERFSMPTRAEICDLAHWTLEDTAGVLLSYETAFGARPVGAVACTARILDHWGSLAKRTVNAR